MHRPSRSGSRAMQPWPRASDGSPAVFAGRPQAFDGRLWCLQAGPTCCAFWPRSHDEAACGSFTFCALQKSQTSHERVRSSHEKTAQSLGDPRGPLAPAPGHENDTTCAMCRVPMVSAEYIRSADSFPHSPPLCFPLLRFPRAEDVPPFLPHLCLRPDPHSLEALSVGTQCCVLMHTARHAKGERRHHLSPLIDGTGHRLSSMTLEHSVRCVLDRVHHDPSCSITTQACTACTLRFYCRAHRHATWHLAGKLLFFPPLQAPPPAEACSGVPERRRLQ